MKIALALSILISVYSLAKSYDLEQSLDDANREIITLSHEIEELEQN